MGIGEGRIGFPNALGQPAKGFLGFNAVVLPILLDFGKSIMIFLLYELDDIAEIAVQNLANLR